MSVADDALDAILSRVSTQLGATFSEHARAHDLESLGAHQLQNGYSMIWEPAEEDIGTTLNQLRLTRTAVVNVTYRTFSTATDDKTKVVQDTALLNEENIVNDLRLRALSGVNARILRLIDSDLSTFEVDNDHFLLNTIRFQVFYLVT